MNMKIRLMPSRAWADGMVREAADELVDAHVVMTPYARRILDVLEEPGALGRIQLRRAARGSPSSRVSSITSFTRARACAFWRQFRTRACRDPLEDVPRDLLDLLTLLGRQLRTWPSEEIEHGQLLFRQLLAYVALLLVGQGLRQREELAEQVIDVAAAVVVRLDQLLELRQVIHARRVA